MGVLAPGPAHARRYARPSIDMSGNFLAHLVCRVNFKHLPQPLRRYIWSDGTIRQFFKIPTLSAQKCHSAGGRVGPRIFCLIGILIFLLLRSPCKISESYDKFSN